MPIACFYPQRTQTERTRSHAPAASNESRGGGGRRRSLSLLAILFATAALAWFSLGGHAGATPGSETTVTWTYSGEHEVKREVQVLSGLKAKLVTSGSEYAYALTEDSELKSWGLNHAGQRNTPSSMVWPGNVNGRHSNRSLVEVKPTTYSHVDAGDLHTCAVTTQGEIDCWGSNSHGQTNVPMRLLVQQDDPSVPTPKWIKVSAGGEHTCALRDLGEENEVLCWGSNSHGQSNAPDGDYVDVSAGGQHTCAVEREGAVVCWGNNAFGQTNEPSDGSYHSISAGNNHSCAINAEGGALCWGSNLRGQEYPPAGEYTQITSGGWHACALWTTDDAPRRGSPAVAGNQSPPGNVDCWGDNSGGKATPPVGVSFKQISAGGTFTCGVRTDEFVQCWGFGSVARKAPTTQIRYRTVTVDSTWTETQTVQLPTTGRVIARTSSDGSMEFRFQVVRPGPNNDSYLSVFRRFVPSDGSLTVGRWYYSDVLTVTEVIEPPAGALETKAVEVECDIGRIGIRLLATGHIELALMSEDGSVKMIPQNHNRIPNPAEVGVWWRTDQVRFGN